MQGETISESPNITNHRFHLFKFYYQHITLTNLYPFSVHVVTFTFHYQLMHLLINPLNPELNPVCYLLALLGAHHFLHVSRIRVKSLTLRVLMSCIYIYIYMLRSWVRIPPGAWIFVCCECRVLSGRGLCDELITRPEETYRLCCVFLCDQE